MVISASSASTSLNRGFAFRAKKYPVVFLISHLLSSGKGHNFATFPSLTFCKKKSLIFFLSVTRDTAIKQKEKVEKSGDTKFSDKKRILCPDTHSRETDYTQEV